MNTDLDNKINEYTYRLLSVEKTQPPKGMPEGNWHQYIIGRGKSIIEGLQIGSLAAVTQYAEVFVEGLNERAANGSSAYHAARKKK
jgi:hypothetical protein